MIHRKVGKYFVADLSLFYMNNNSINSTLFTGHIQKIYKIYIENKFCLLGRINFHIYPQQVFVAFKNFNFVLMQAALPESARKPDKSQQYFLTI